MRLLRKIASIIVDVLMFVLGCGGRIRNESVDDGLCDFGGQGRDEYGR